MPSPSRSRMTGSPCRCHFHRTPSRRCCCCCRSRRCHFHRRRRSPPSRRCCRRRSSGQRRCRYSRRRWCCRHWRIRRPLLRLARWRLAPCRSRRRWRALPSQQPRRRSGRADCWPSACRGRMRRRAHRARRDPRQRAPWHCARRASLRPCPDQCSQMGWCRWRRFQYPACPSARGWGRSGRW